MKKLLFILLLALFLPLTAWADVWQDPETGVNYEYTEGSGEASVIKSNVGGNIPILPYIIVNEYFYEVTSIGESAFKDCKGLTSINMPEELTSIAPRAFENCSSLTSIIIPESVTNIGYFAFYNCSGLTSINIPESVNNMGRQAFDGCI